MPSFESHMFVSALSNRMPLSNLRNDTLDKKRGTYMPESGNATVFSAARLIACHLIPLSRLPKTNWIDPKHQIRTTNTISLNCEMFDDACTRVFFEQAHLAVSRRVR